MNTLPTKLDASLKQYHHELLHWLDEGGDSRLKEFAPLVAWQKVLKELAKLDHGHPPKWT